MTACGEHERHAGAQPRNPKAGSNSGALSKRYTSCWQAEVFRLRSVEAGTDVAKPHRRQEAFENFQDATTLAPRSTVQKDTERNISFPKR